MQNSSLDKIATQNCTAQWKEREWANPFRKSSNEREKQFQILAKGHNETDEIVIPMEYARFLTGSVGEHVSENGGTWSWHFPNFAVRAKASDLTLNYWFQ
jgi:hypothetical protein